MTEKDLSFPAQEADALLRDREALRRLAGSSDARALMALLQQLNGADLQAAARSAAAGDPAALTALLDRAVRTPEGARAVQGIEKQLSK